MERTAFENDPAFRLATAVRELSLARDLGRVREVVRRAARELTGADGATFVLREGTSCHYFDEDAIAPLWKGRRFPMSSCISGWAMLNRQAVAIEDIYADARIPADAYRPTFVQSLAMVPIRQNEPIGAIGNYWATRHAPTSRELQLLQALADSTSVAMENVQVYTELEQRVRDRTRELEQANRELEAFSSAVSHDLRAPVRHIRGYADILRQRAGLGAEGLMYLGKIERSAARMGELIEDMLKLARISQWNLRRVRTDLSAIASEIAMTTRGTEPERDVTFAIEPGLVVQGDPGLLRIALENLMGNAWKFTARRPQARIEVGIRGGKKQEFYVKDNGPGFRMEQAGRLFQPFSRLHSQDEFPGHGIGLATVHRIVEKHGGRIRAEAAPDEGAGFYFTLE